MPIQNISATFTDEQLDDLKEAIVAHNEAFPVLVSLTDAERRSLPRVAAGRETFCETSFTGAGSFPTVVPVYIKVVEWTKDETYFDQLGEVEILLESLLAKVKDTRQAVGAERYRQARKFYEVVKAAREDVPGLQALYDSLSEQFQNSGPDEGEEEPPADDGDGENPGGGA